MSVNVDTNNELFLGLGFSWDRASLPAKVPDHSVERACFRFQRMLPEFVWDAAVLEGNPFTFPEVKTLLDWVTVGGRKLSDQEQILNLAESSKVLLAMVNEDKSFLNKIVFREAKAISSNESTSMGIKNGFRRGGYVRGIVFF